MKPILPSRPNHWALRRLRDAMRGVSSTCTKVTAGHAPWSSGQASSGTIRRMNQLDLQGRNAVVTGGAAGIGFAIAQRLAHSGAQVTLWDRDAVALAEAAKAIADGAHLATVDVSDEAQVERALDETLKKMPRVDALVCSAGITGPNTTTWEYPVEAWKQVIDINLTGVFLCNRAVVRHMRKSDYGRIVNI